MPVTRLFLAFFALFLVAAAARAAETLEQLQQRFDKETDGIHKAKLMQKLGDAQFEKERQAARDNDYLTVGLVMEKYRDNVRAALDLLKKTHPDAEKHPGGYKPLEMHLGRGIREVHDVLLVMPDAYRPPMQIVERDLRDMDAELLRLLFPRRPGEQPLPPPPASSEKPPADSRTPADGRKDPS
ncbi:MAG TPA: hypothetical protein VMT51_03580 [Dongiaceae bacterium]|nr:hypothetical protein [Dongiaceae bacterium]